jgi:hypothetical protein
MAESEQKRRVEEATERLTFQTTYKPYIRQVDVEVKNILGYLRYDTFYNMTSEFG